MATSDEKLRDIAEAARHRFASLDEPQEAIEVCDHPLRDDLRVTYRHRSSPSADEDAWLALRLLPQAGKLWIEDLWVADDQRRRGCGSRLVACVERFARDLDITTIEAMPLRRARAFWEKLGFRPHPRVARVVAKHVPVVDAHE